MRKLLEVQWGASITTAKGGVSVRRYKHGRCMEPLLQMGNHRSRYKNPFKGRNELTSRM